MADIDPEQQRAFAVEVLSSLRSAGYESLWAGGCVRDYLLGRVPKDYDVATNATPTQVRRLFGRRRTLAIGAAFGVIAVVGPRPAGIVEVTTFRSDAAYSDGRRPDAVTFTTAQADAQRRDFTVNGLFYDPLTQQVLDYVDGLADLEARRLRAIGDARQRFAEDKLRMLRGVRIAANYDLTIDDATLAAIQNMADEVISVSAERIGQEMRGMMTSPGRVRGLRLLVESGLARPVLPDLLDLERRPAPAGDYPNAWEYVLAIIGALDQPSISLVLAALAQVSHNGNSAEAGERAAATITRWRLSKDFRDRARWLAEHSQALETADNEPWSQIQPLLVAPGGPELVEFHRARAVVEQRQLAAVEYCLQWLARPAEVLNPPPLVGGNDLAALGLAPGPLYAQMLQRVRNAQLDGLLANRSAALDFVRSQQ